MLTTACPKLLIFAEGMMERIFVNANFPRAQLVPLQNGDSWTLAAMVKQIENKFLAKNFFPEHLIVWFDVEGRDFKYNDVHMALVKMFVSHGIDASVVSLLLANRSSENLILADEDAVRTKFSLVEYSYEGDGSPALKKLEDLFAQAGGRYRKTFDGPSLLKGVRLRRCSTSDFVISFLATFKYDCWWLA